MNKLMAGIEDLKILLSSMKPELDSREFVFCTFDNPLSMEAITDLTPIGTFREKEGLTLIITTDDALSNGIRFDTVYKLISLTVHSSPSPSNFVNLIFPSHLSNVFTIRSVSVIGIKLSAVP